MVVVSDQASAPGSYSLYYTRAPGANEGGVLVNGVASGVIDAGDLDSFTFYVVPGESVQLQVAESVDTAFAPMISIYDATGARIRTASGFVSAAVSLTASSGGKYTLVVSDKVLTVVPTI